MASEPSVTAILVAYNSAGVIGKALAPLLASPETTSVIVVDNCSSDDTCDLIRRDFPTVTLIENPRNEGFGRANNAALNKVTTPYALLINPDAVLQAGALEKLLAAAGTYPDAAILAPALYNERGELHLSFKNNVWQREKRYYGASRNNAEGELCAEYLSGAVWLFNMKRMRQVGFFDPNIFLYYEDDDLCLRVRRARCGLVYVPAAIAIHGMGGSSGAHSYASEFLRQQHMAWSRLYIEEKYRGKKMAARLAARLNLLYSLKTAFYFIYRNRMRVARYRGRLRGIFAYLEKLPVK